MMGGNVYSLLSLTRLNYSERTGANGKGRTLCRILYTNAVGIGLHSPLESSVATFIKAKPDMAKGVLAGLDKSLELNYRITDLTGDALIWFGKYLLLSADFLKMAEQQKSTLKPADAHA